MQNVMQSRVALETVELWATQMRNNELAKLGIAPTASTGFSTERNQKRKKNGNALRILLTDMGSLM